MEKMKNYMKRISIEGSRNRYVAILDILDEIGVEFRIQEEIHSYDVPIFEEVETKSVPGQMSLFDFVGNVEKFDEDGVLEEYDALKEIASIMGIEFEEDDRDDIYEKLFKLSEELELNGVDMGEFETSYTEPKIIRYDKKVDSVSNIIISLGSYCDNPNANKIVLTAHYDAVWHSTGANDNASAITILLLFIEEVMKRGKTSNLFEIVFLDREETGGKGCINYLSEYGDNIKEIINLDTCGVGESIVVSDYSRHITDETVVLFNKCIKKQFNVVETDYLPYCDSDIMKRQRMDVITICTLPPNDVEYFRHIRLRPAEKLRHLLSGDYYRILNGINLIRKDLMKKKLGSNFEVYKYMHNGACDSIEYINYDIMTSILKYIELLI